MSRIWNVLTRRKVLESSEGAEGAPSKLARVLGAFDLTALGVGSTLGVGVYVLAGHVAKESAGPSVILSFLIAAIASVFAGLCYAEFGARAPRAGSAYIYSYVSVGEFVAFIIGWNLILEYVIGSASVARGLTLYIDSLVNDTLKNTFTDIAPISWEYMSSYFDFCSCGISLLLAVGLAFGLKECSYVNNTFTVLNIGVVLFVIIAGSINANTDNWSVPANQTVEAIGEGGFFPFGVEGMIKGAATCFYGFIGFDCIATTGEEVRNPQRAIPLSIILSLAIIFLSYFGISTVVTLMVPYYLQDENAPIPYAFELVGWEWAKWVVAIGGIFGLCASLFGAMFPLPRILYAMASDGLVFRFLGTVTDRFSTNVIGTLLAGLLTGLMAALFELKQLVNMMSIGTLLAYTIVAACVLLLRYAEGKAEYLIIHRYSSSSEDETIYRDYDGGLSIINKDTINDSDEYDYPSDRFTFGGFMNQYFNFSRRRYPTKLSETLVNINVILYCILCLLLGLCIMYFKDEIAHGEIWAIVITSVIVFFMMLTIFSIWLQPTSNRVLSFKVPFVPLVPALSILINIYLMLMLDVNTWIRFGVWMIIGLLIYFLSVRAYSWAPHASNLIVTSKQGDITNGKLSNGHTNMGYVNEESIEEVDEFPGLIDERLKQRKSRAPLPPIDRRSSVDVVLDELDDVLNDHQLERNLSVDTQASSVFDQSPNVAETVTVTALVHPFKPTLTEQKVDSRLSQATNDKCIVTAIRNSQELASTITDDEIIFGLQKAKDDDQINDSGTASIDYNNKEPEPEVCNEGSAMEDNEDKQFIDLEATSPTTIEASNGSFNGDLESSSLTENLSFLEQDSSSDQSETEPVKTSLEDVPLAVEHDPPVILDEPIPIIEEVKAVIPPPPPPIPTSHPYNFISRKSTKKPQDSSSDKFNTLPSAAPPTPPPIEGFKTISKKPSFRQTSMEAIFNQIRDNKPILKKTSPKLPSRKNSVDEFVDVKEVDDNVKFGSKQHEKIRKTLGALFTTERSSEMLVKKNTFIMPTVSPNVKPRATTELPRLNIQADGTVDDVPAADIRKMLNTFLVDRASIIVPNKSAANSSPVSERSTTSALAEKAPESSNDPPSRREHSIQMRNTLTAINKGLVNDLKKTFAGDT